MNTDGDHSRAVKDLMKNALDIFALHETIDALGISGHRIHVLKPLQQVQIGSWTVKPFPLVHDVPNVGFLISNGQDKILYACDTNYIPYKFKGLTHILLGVNFDTEILKKNVERGIINAEVAKRIIRNHLGIETAKGFFKSNDMATVQQIHLLHLSTANSNAKAFTKEVQQITGRPTYVGG